MKKLIVTLTLLSALVTAVFGQSFSTDYVLKNFPGTRLDAGRLVGTRSHIKDVQISPEELEIYGGMHNSRAIDSAAELLAMASVLGIQDVPKADALNLYAEISIENSMNQYFNKTGTTHDAVLSRLRGKYNFTQREIDSAVSSQIAAAVDAGFNNVSFTLDNTTIRKSYDAVLTRNPQNGQYVLSYERLGTVYTPITGTSLEDLLAKVSRNADFNQTSIDQVRTQAALIPAVVYADWKSKGFGDGMAVVKEALTNFYLRPSQDTYNAVVGIYARHYAQGAAGDMFAPVARGAYISVLSSLNTELSRSVTANGSSIAAARVPNDARYDIFTRRFTQ